VDDRGLPEPDEGHFFLQGSATDPDMRHKDRRHECPFCGGGRLVDRCRDLGVAACCGGCGYYTHEDDEVQDARVAAEKARERYEREAQEQQQRCEAAAKKARRGKKRSRMAA
jgi:hypothetical protein